MKLSKAIEGYKLDKEFVFAYQTKYAYDKRLGFFFDFMGDVEIEAITKTDIRKFLVHVRDERNLGDRSIYDYYTTLSSLWTWAENEIKLDHVVKQVPRPTYTKKTMQYFSRKEVESLIKGLDYTAEYVNRHGQVVKNSRATRLRDKAMVIVLLDCGLRISELINLKIKDYNSSRGTLFIAHGKGDKERVVPLGSNARKAIWRYLVTRDGQTEDDPLFLSRNGGHLSRSGLGKTLKIIAKRVGVNHVHAHKFRHTFAITFLRNGGNVLELQAIIGHEDIETLKEYVRLAAVDIENAQRKHSPADKWRL